MWVPWWKNAELSLKKKMQERRRNFGFGSKEGIFGLCVSDQETFHPGTQWMLWCFLSIVYCQRPPSLTLCYPTTHPLHYYWKKHRVNQWIPHLFCFQKYPTSKIFVRRCQDGGTRRCLKTIDETEDGLKCVQEHGFPNQGGSRSTASTPPFSLLLEKKPLCLIYQLLLASRLAAMLCLARWCCYCIIYFSCSTLCKMCFSGSSRVKREPALN